MTILNVNKLVVYFSKVSIKLYFQNLLARDICVELFLALNRDLSVYTPKEIMLVHYTYLFLSVGERRNVKSNLIRVHYWWRSRIMFSTKQRVIITYLSILHSYMYFVWSKENLYVCIFELIQNFDSQGGKQFKNYKSLHKE